MATALACEKSKQDWVANPKTMTGRSYELTVVGVKRCDNEAHQRRQPGSILLGIDVIVQATTDAELYIGPSALRAKDSQANAYSPVIGGGCQPELPSMSAVKKGEKLRGIITLELPEAVNELKCSLRMKLDDEAKFDLRR